MCNLVHSSSVAHRQSYLTLPFFQFLLWSTFFETFYFKWSVFTGPISLSNIFRCLSYHSLHSCKNPSIFFPHHFINLIISYFILYSSAELHMQHPHFCCLQFFFMFPPHYPTFSTITQSASHIAFFIQFH